MTDLNSQRRGGHFEEHAFRPAELIRTQTSMISSRSNPVATPRPGTGAARNRRGNQCDADGSATRATPRRRGSATPEPAKPANPETR
jgi:hypothetical protein